MDNKRKLIQIIMIVILVIATIMIIMMAESGTSINGKSTEVFATVKVAEPVDSKPKPTVIFYAPHEDDETLSMSVAIRDYLRDGYDVKVVLLTRGESSGAIDLFNGKIYCNLHKTRHNFSLTKEEFSNIRVEETKNALAYLGVPSENIDIRNLGDGNVKVDEVEGVMEEYLSLYPNALHCSMSYKDVHPDHINSGLALRNLYNEGIIKNVKFYINQIQHNTVAGTYEPYNKDLDYEAIRNALNCFIEWSPMENKYGIGYHSVTSMFKSALDNPRSKYHLINE